MTSNLGIILIIIISNTHLYISDFNFKLNLNSIIFPLSNYIYNG